MSQEAFKARSTEAENVDTFVNFTGNGTGAITENFGRGVTTTRTGVGILTLVWDEFPGKYMGVKGWCFEATTASSVKGFTCVPGDYNSTTRTLTINLTNAGETLVDLSTVQRLSITVAFKRTGTGV